LPTIYFSHVTNRKPAGFAPHWGQWRQMTQYACLFALKMAIPR
jgi:hypothetical protein